jgi:hypothetical protein
MKIHLVAGIDDGAKRQSERAGGPTSEDDVSGTECKPKTASQAFGSGGRRGRVRHGVGEPIAAPGHAPALQWVDHSHAKGFPWSRTILSN